MRTKLRECSRLVNCLIYTLDVSLRFHDKENKPVENCTCALRNLSYRIQEVSEKDFYKKRTQTLKRMQKPPNKKGMLFLAIIQIGQFILNKYLEHIVKCVCAFEVV